MNADEIFRASVQVMKRLFGEQGVSGAVSRAKERGPEGNAALLSGKRGEINRLVRDILEAHDPVRMIGEASAELRDALVLRYLSNRELFLKTFPDGIPGSDTDPLALWGAMMISPQDEAE